MRASLISLSTYLNSEIDHLALLLVGGPNDAIDNFSFSDRRDGIDRRKTDMRDINVDHRKGPDRRRNEKNVAYELIEELWKGWPSRKTQIEIEIRKLLTELGIHEE